VGFDDPFGQREAEPDASRVAVAAAVRSEEGREEAGLVLGSDADAVVVNRDGDAAVVLLERQLDRRGRLRVAGRIVEQVVEDPREEAGLGRDFRDVGETRSDLASRVQAREAAHRGFDEPAGLDRLAAEDEPASRVQPRGGEQIAHERLQLGHVFLDRLQVARRLPRRRFRGEGEGHADAREGGAELVRDVGEELPVALEQAAQPLRHLVERASERADLVRPVEIRPGGEIALPDPPRDLGEELDGTGDRTGKGSGREGEHRDHDGEHAEEAEQQLAVRDPQGEPQVAPRSRLAHGREVPVARRLLRVVKARHLVRGQGRKRPAPGRGHAAAVVRIDDEVDVEALGELRELGGDGVVGKRRDEAADVLGEPDGIGAELVVAAHEDPGQREGHHDEDEQQHAVQVHAAEERARPETRAHRPDAGTASW
jgi:hypothetical protein